MVGDSRSSDQLYFVSTDLVLVKLLGIWLILNSVVGIGEFPGRVIAGLVAILFAPGYAFVSALFPRQNAGNGSLAHIHAEVTGIDGRVTVIERLLLSVALSVSLVPLFVLGLGQIQLEVQIATSMGAIGVTTVGFAAVALIRRRRVEPAERFDPKITTALRTIYGHIRRPNSPLVVLLAIGFVIAGSGIGVAVLEADRGDHYTEFSLLTEDPETGEVVADRYPQELTENQTEQIQLEITNNEGEITQYSVIVLLQSFNGSGQIQATETLYRFRTTVEPGETAREQRTAQPELTGKNLRLTYLLYIDSPPKKESPSTENAYRHVHLWVDSPG